LASSEADPPASLPAMPGCGKAPGSRDLGRGELRASSSPGRRLPALGLALAAGPGHGVVVQQHHAALGKGGKGEGVGHKQQRLGSFLPTCPRAVSSRTQFMPKIKAPPAKLSGQPPPPRPSPTSSTEPTAAWLQSLWEPGPASGTLLSHPSAPSDSHPSGVSGTHRLLVPDDLLGPMEQRAGGHPWPAAPAGAKQ